MAKTYKCECGKEFTNPQSFNGHKSNCAIHLKATGKYENKMKSMEKQILKTTETWAKKKEELHRRKEEEWRKARHKCERCGKVMKEKYGSGRFCSSFCAHSKKHSREQKEKISSSLKRHNKLHPRVSRLGSERKKEAYRLNPSKCVICGNLLSYEKRNNVVCCKKCQNELESIKAIERCKEQGTNLCGKGKRGYYKGYYCQSSWELAYVVYCLDHGVLISRNKKGFKYEWEQKQRTYFPDFVLPDGTYVEIKGYYDKKSESKNIQFPKNEKLVVLKKKDMEPILDYVIEKYGKSFTDLYES